MLWQNLRDGAGLGARLPDINFDRLIERARSQRAELERLLVLVVVEIMESRADAEREIARYARRMNARRST